MPSTSVATSTSKTPSSNTPPQPDITQLFTVRNLCIPKIHLFLIKCACHDEFYVIVCLMLSSRGGLLPIHDNKLLLCFLIHMNLIVAPLRVFTVSFLCRPVISLEFFVVNLLHKESICDLFYLCKKTTICVKKNSKTESRF